MMEHKYVVFKKDDLDEALDEALEGTNSVALPEPITDCFVIRFQDVLAGPGLHAYAHAAQTFIEGIESQPGESTPWDIVERLQHTRDAAFDAANIADNYPSKKVPD